MKPATRRFAILCVLLLALGSVFAAGAGAQKPARPAAPPSGEQEGFFMDTVNVNVVNVDVYVTEKGGKRVTGLTRDDFEIFENGRPIQITNFYAVEGGRPVAAPEEEAPAPQTAEAPGAPVPAPATVERPPLPEDQRLRLVVYIDNFNLRPFNRNRVMRELRAFLGTKLNKDDQIMLVTYDRELHVRRSFTSDPGLIAASLLELEKVSAHAVHQDSERRDVMRRIEESQSAHEAENHARTYAQSVFNDLSFSIDALKEITNALAGMPGRKAVLYVSDGLQMIAGQDVFYAVQNKYGEQSVSLTEAFTYDASRRIQELAAQANANRITYYTIDAAGLRVYDSSSAENTGHASAPGLSTLVDSVRISNLQSPLQMLAERTGGVAVLNANIVTPQLERIAEDFGSYYSLGYSPTHYGDGRYYKIEVKVKRKGIQVRHREGYRDKSTEARMSDSTLAALNFPYEDNPLGVSLEFGTPQARQDGFYLTPLNVRIPLGKLVLVPREQTHEAKVRVFVAAMDSSGNTSEVQQTPVPISIPNGDVTTATGKDYIYTISLLMRPGDQRVAIGVRDDVAGEASFLSRGVRVGGGPRRSR